MRKLILVRHSLSDPDRSQPSEAWDLSQEGRRRAELLAARLDPFLPFALYASPEPKALQTAAPTALRFGVPVREVDGLREHSRRTMPWYDNAGTFDEAVIRFFRSPDALVLGEETASQAAARFEGAVAQALESAPGNCVIVSHGSVIALFMAKRTGADPVEVWKSLAQPWYAVLSGPEFRVLEIVREFR